MPRPSPFPPVDLEESLIIAKTIVNNNAGKPMRRLTIFDIMGKSPESSISRALITASSGYGLTHGGYSADIISLTERGYAIVVNSDAQARLDAVLNVKLFEVFFDHYRNSTFPANSAAIDFLVKDQGLPPLNAKSCLDILQKCGEQVSLIQEISNTKRIVTKDHALETILKNADESVTPKVSELIPANQPDNIIPNGINVTTESPSIHLDIQIHISADASSDQIDMVFASMAKHLFPPK